MKLQRYRVPPKKAFRAMGLGVVSEGCIRCVAGFRFQWWVPGGSVIPLIVNARVLRVHETRKPA